MQSSAVRGTLGKSPLSISTKYPCLARRAFALFQL